MVDKGSVTTSVLNGYAHQGYAASLAEFGVPSELPKCSGWILKRGIPGTRDVDAMGPYPIFSCADWGKLASDLTGMGEGLVSLCAVLDPFGDHNEIRRKECFPDLVLPFKEHFVTDLSKTIVAAHHRRNARKALRQLRVNVSTNPSTHLQEWIELYDNLIQRHTIRDIRAFSECAFAQQFKVPGIVAFRAVFQERTVGMLLWYTQGDVAFYHLGAYSGEGYQTRASFALFWTAIEYFRSRNVRWLDLGAGAGIGSKREDGLTRFKRGWSTGTRTAYFCGRILNREAYEHLTKLTGNSGGTPNSASDAA